MIRCLSLAQRHVNRSVCNSYHQHDWLLTGPKHVKRLVCKSSSTSPRFKLSFTSPKTREAKKRSGEVVELEEIFDALRRKSVKLIPVRDLLSSTWSSRTKRSDLLHMSQAADCFHFTKTGCRLFSLYKFFSAHTFICPGS